MSQITSLGRNVLKGLEYEIQRRSIKRWENRTKSGGRLTTSTSLPRPLHGGQTAIATETTCATSLPNTNVHHIVRKTLNFWKVCARWKRLQNATNTNACGYFSNVSIVLENLFERLITEHVPSRLDVCSAVYSLLQTRLVDPKASRSITDPETIQIDNFYGHCAANKELRANWIFYQEHLITINTDRYHLGVRAITLEKHVKLSHGNATRWKKSRIGWKNTSGKNCNVHHIWQHQNFVFLVRRKSRRTRLWNEVL